MGISLNLSIAFHIKPEVQLGDVYIRLIKLLTFQSVFKYLVYFLLMY